MDMKYRGGCGKEGVGRMEWNEGGKWDNCNSIINKYIFKKEKQKQHDTTKNGRSGKTSLREDI